MFGVAGNVRPEAAEVVASTCGQREFYMPPSGKHLWERRPRDGRLWAAGLQGNLSPFGVFDGSLDC